MTTARVVALAASLGAHGLVALLGLAGAAHAPARSAAPLERPDVWSGETIEVDGLVTSGARGGTQAAEPAAPTLPAPESRPLARPEPAVAEPPTPTPARPARLEVGSMKLDPTSRGPAVVPEPRPRARPPRRREPAEPRAKPDVAPAPSGPVAGAAGESPALAASPAEPAAPGTSAGDGAPAAFGAAGLAPGVRDLGKAFARAMPRAMSGDPLWSSLPLGDAGSFRVSLTLDERGRLSEARSLDENPPPQLEHLLERTVLLLRGGLFALSLEGGAGSQTLRISVTLSQGTPSDELDVNPSDTTSLGFEPPRPGRPGRGYFTLASGRHVEARVWLE
ncbi:MAG: hypothetical protein OZ921_01250 [Sorangiineae bacterium]|nr:hypothetical protein [Polyangiaceae bacterium]MEB2321110.1 hypothetical protein [Sorangiineae bacterium]